MSEFQKLALERFSCRKFSDASVDNALIEKVLKIALAAPTAVNKQPFRIWVLSGDVAQRFVEHNPYHFGVKTFILVGTSAEEAWVRRYDQQNFANVDGAIITTHIMLALTDCGLKTCWVASFDAPAVHEALPETAAYNLIAAFPVAWPAEDAQPSASHTKSRSYDELVHHLS